MNSNAVLSAAQSPSPYGRACLACIKSKLKCVRNGSGERRCERCIRLNGDCEQPAVRKRRIPRRMDAGKLAKSEAQLKGDQNHHQVVGQSTSESSQFSLPFGRHQTGSGHQSMAMIPVQIEKPINGLDPTYTSAPLQQTPPPGLLAGIAQPSLAETEKRLDVFRAGFLGKFPFMVLPKETGASELRAKYPSLYLSIMAVTCNSLTKQMTLGIELRATVARKSLVEGEKSLDLLLACLSYINWCAPQFHQQSRHAPIISSLSALAMSLIWDLGLSRPAPVEPQHVMLNYSSRGCPKPFNASQRTMEERRAVIACFYVTSVIAAFSQKMDALRWTPYLDECLQILAENAEQPSDVLLANIVRYQLITDEVSRATRGEESSHTSVEVPGAFYLKTLQARLDDAKSKTPPDLQNNTILLLNLHHAELSVYETVLLKSPYPPLSSEFQRLEYMYTSLDAVNSWFTLLFTIPPADYVELAFATFAQMLHCLTTLCRLSTFVSPAWDLGLVSQRADFSLILSQIAKNMSNVAKAAGMDVSNFEGVEVYCLIEKNIMALKSWWDAKVAGDAGTSKMTINEVCDEAFMDFLDDAWLGDLLRSPEYQFEPY